MLAGNTFLSFALAAALGYALGSIPFGLVFTKLAGTADIRSIGSGNIGATNVLRTGRKGLAAATLIADMLKGTLAVLIVLWWSDRDHALAAGVGAFLGHLFPVWLRFKGGKGVATFLGLLLALSWQAALVFAIVWLAIGAATRYSSVASMIACMSAPAWFFYAGARNEMWVFLALALLSIVMHRGNIARLIDGTEGKVGKKA
jgi:glycerol-3-phosphate acyltransferase PlsY